MNALDVSEALAAQVKFATSQLESFAADLAKDPTEALRWSAQAFEAAAKIRVAKTVLSVFDKGGMDLVREMVTREVVRGARDPQRSTSMASNLLHQCEVSAWAEVLEMLDRA